MPSIHLTRNNTVQPMMKTNHATPAATMSPSTPVDQLSFDGVDLEQLALRIPTPFHAYSATAIRQRIGGLQAALSGLDATICQKKIAAKLRQCASITSHLFVSSPVGSTF